MLGTYDAALEKEVVLLQEIVPVDGIDLLLPEDLPKLAMVEGRDGKGDGNGVELSERSGRLWTKN